jgi:hypothetical protein
MMPRTRRLWPALLTVLLLSLERHGSAEPITYTFTAIAPDIRQSGFSQTISAPALNNLGMVAFTIDLAGAVGGVSSLETAAHLPRSSQKTLSFLPVAHPLTMPGWWLSGTG